MKRTIVTALALSGALALGACGSTTADTGTGSKAGTSQEAPAAAVKVGDTVDLAELATKSSAAVKDKGSAHMTMDLGAEGKAEADVDYSGTSPKMAMTMTVSGEKLDLVYVDKVMYMGGASFAQMAGGKKWIKIDPNGKDQMSQMMGPMLGQMESSMSNPAEQLKGFEGAKATVKSIEGGNTTYTVKLTKEQLAAAVKKQAAGVPGLTEESLKQMPDGMTYDLTFDKDQLPLTMSMDVSGQALKMTYSKWGEPVSIKAPAASEVGTFELPTS
ncbi:hypothetical protein G7075_00955 [Phycicoccus sp. HDW14]|uniref:hypothetical protein n=1 Tax=Phycicoccus sp. HDW14 TaxID=2714941 RepID=UPI001408913B|nr:hypothetical protein [Phycicoccus sp. HDW14]QIM20041.1 hypothetical protein G7075_00955 [Phycicoccus sp. HDW14]